MPEIDFSKFDKRPRGQDVSEAMPLGDYLIDMSREYPHVDFLLHYDGRGCLPCGDLQVITGKQKAGKTFAALSMEVALLRGDFMGFKAIKKDVRVLHVDTEQSAGNIVKRAKTVHSACGWSPSANNERYKVISLRESAYDERARVTFEAIEAWRPHFVFIDGIRDLCRDFNDIGESAALVNELMRVSSRGQCAILNVLHENKGDGNMRGHLGTELANKCSEVYQVAKEGDTITVKQIICRNIPIVPWAFRIGDAGVPEPDFVNDRTATRRKKDEDLLSLFGQKAQYKYTDLVNALMHRSGCSESTSKKHITKAAADGIIIKLVDGVYSLPDAHKWSKYDDEIYM